MLEQEWCSLPKLFSCFLMFFYSTVSLEVSRFSLSFPRQSRLWGLSEVDCRYL